MSFLPNEFENVKQKCHIEISKEKENNKKPNWFNVER